MFFSFVVYSLFSMGKSFSEKSLPFFFVSELFVPENRWMNGCKRHTLCLESGT